MRSSLLVLAIVAVPSIAAAGPIELSAKTALPIVTPTLTVTPDSNTYLGTLGFACPQSGNAAPTPAATLELSDELTGLRIALRDGDRVARFGAVLVMPDGSFHCEDDHQEIAVATWPKGRYQIYFFVEDGGSASLSGQLRIERPADLARAATDAFAKMTPIVLGSAGGNGGANPVFVTATPGPAIAARDLALPCQLPNDSVVAPLATLQVTAASDYYVHARDRLTFIVTADGACLDDAKVKLSPGTHQLWTYVDPRAPATVEVEADDRDRPLGFGDATRKTLTDLAEPMILDGTVRAAEDWPARNECSRLARAPDFYLTSDTPLQHVVVQLLWSRRSEAVHVLGPLSKLDTRSTLDCFDRATTRSFDVVEGTYAVWVGSGNDDDATGEPFHLLIRRSDVALDPLKTLTTIPTDLAIPDRAYPHFYPYFAGTGEADWKALFTGAPDQLFVYPRVDTGGVPAGEPLLVDGGDHEQVLARRWDGSQARLATDLLTTDRPAVIALPSRPPAHPIDDVQMAIDASGAEDLDAIDRFGTLRSKFELCETKYLEKHDPTWGTGDQLYTISSRGHITNVNERVGKAADRACGLTRLDKAEKKLLAALAKTRAARWKAHLAAVRARFGLD